MTERAKKALLSLVQDGNLIEAWAQDMLDGRCTLDEGRDMLDDLMGTASSAYGRLEVALDLEEKAAGG